MPLVLNDNLQTSLSQLSYVNKSFITVDINSKPYLKYMFYNCKTTISLHIPHLLVTWKTLLYLLSVLFVPSENLIQHKQLKHICSRMCCFLPMILMLLADKV